MQDKRYQVFISSTFKDLQDERRAVQDAIIAIGDFPVQMESFPAADEDQFEFIRSLIDQCDYYVLIIAGKYGSLDEDGLSYTHKEYRYAVDKQVPVLVMLHGAPGKIEADKLEETDAGRTALQAFIKEVEKNRLRKTWISLGDLKLAVREALDHAKATKPRVGWVRGDSIASNEILEELNDVRKENERYRDLLGTVALDIPLPPLPAAGDETVITLVPSVGFQQRGTQMRGSSAKVSGPWISFFPLLYSNLDHRTNDWNGDYYVQIDYDDSSVAIGSAIAAELSSLDTKGLFKLTRPSLDKLIAYYTEIGLMISGTLGESPFTDEAKRVARRYYISETTPKFRLVEGEILTVEISAAYSTDLDDNIPF